MATMRHTNHQQFNTTKAKQPFIVIIRHDVPLNMFISLRHQFCNVLQRQTIVAIRCRGLATTTTTRDAPLPPLSNPVEQAILAAKERGDFNNLSGKGKPLPKRDIADPIAGISNTDLLHKRAEVEMRQYIDHHAKEDLQDHYYGKKLPYKGTNIVGTSSSSGSGSGSESGLGSSADAVVDAMGKYIIKESQQPTSASNKNL